MHSLTQQTPFNVLLGGNHVTPFDFSKKIITSAYAQNHKSFPEKIYSKDILIIKTKRKESKRKKKSEPQHTAQNQTVYIKTRPNQNSLKHKLFKDRKYKY